MAGLNGGSRVGHFWEPSPPALSPFCLKLCQSHPRPEPHAQLLPSLPCSDASFTFSSDKSKILKSGACLCTDAAGSFPPKVKAFSRPACPGGQLVLVDRHYMWPTWALPCPAFQSSAGKAGEVASSTTTAGEFDGEARVA